MEMFKITNFCDYFVIVSATNRRQTQALADAIEEGLFKNGFKVYRRQNDAEYSWVVLDFFDVVVHIFYSEMRKVYNLERLWVDAKHISIE